MRKVLNYRFWSYQVRTRTNSKSGFTLPELLIVIAVIAALASIVLVSFPATQKRSRDTRRKSDLKQYQTAIEVYYNRQNSYPAWSGNLATAGHCTTLALSSCPDDPKTTQHYSVASTAADYRLWTQLEQPPSPTTWFYTCSSGKAGEATSNPGTTNPC